MRKQRRDDSHWRSLHYDQHGRHDNDTSDHDHDHDHDHDIGSSIDDTYNCDDGRPIQGRD